jgi:hypothetical protein
VEISDDRWVRSVALEIGCQRFVLTIREHFNGGSADKPTPATLPAYVLPHAPGPNGRDGNSEAVSRLFGGDRLARIEWCQDAGVVDSR